MEQILDALQIDWVKAQLPLEDVTAEVIYLSKHICFTLSKIPSDVGDLYRLTMPYPNIIPEHSFILNKLACAGLRFVFNTNYIYEIDNQQTMMRINNETFPTYDLDFRIEYFQLNEDDDIATMIDDYYFDTMEENINEFRESNTQTLHTDLLELSYYIEHCHFISNDHFSTGNRWNNIAIILLSIAKFSVRNHEFTTAAIILFSINSIIKRVGDTADISFVRNAKEFAALYTSNNTGDLLLKRWAIQLLYSIQFHNRIFYEI